ncbi:MAG: hypothetical protein WCT05_15385, partial [Lentisphaeria bacterium]
FNIADYKEKYFKDFPPEKNSITLEFSAEIDDFFKRAIVEDGGKIIELSMSVHVGNFQDSCLIGDGADGGKYDIRYYPNNIIEFYTFDTDCCCSPFLSLPCPRHLPKTAPMFCRITA